MTAAQLVQMALAPAGQDTDEIALAINLALPCRIGVGLVTAEPELRVRAAPSLTAAVVGKVLQGATVYLWGRYGDWWLIDQPVGWVSGAFVQRG